jgi:rRNA maturation endonuclease Nob1
MGKLLEYLATIVAQVVVVSDEDEDEQEVAACEGCGNTLNDGSDICDQCGGMFK